MKIVTGVGENAHVTSKEFRRIIESMAGQGSFIIKCGDNMATDLVSNNLLKIKSGAMIHHGNISSVDPYDEIEINNGTQGMKRIDLVVNRYTKNAETEIENNEWVVIQGTPAASNPEVPAYTVGNLQNGNLVDDCPFCQIIIDGINVTEVKELLTIMPSIPELNDEVAELNSNAKILNPTRIIDSNADLNDYFEIGSYICQSAGISATLKNTPYTVGGFTLHVSRGTGAETNRYRRQLLESCHSTGATFVRTHHHTNGWGEWQEFALVNKLNETKNELADLKNNLTTLYKPKTTLWTGEWSSGNITVPNTDKYSVYAITLSGAATVILAYRHSTYVRGMGGYPLAEGRLTTYQIATVINGNTWSLVKCSKTEQLENGFILDSTMTITSIIGII